MQSEKRPAGKGPRDVAGTGSSKPTIKNAKGGSDLAPTSYIPLRALAKICATTV